MITLHSSNSSFISSETFLGVFTDFDTRPSYPSLVTCELSVSATDVDVLGRDVNNISSGSSVSFFSNGPPSRFPEFNHQE